MSIKRFIKERLANHLLENKSITFKVEKNEDGLDIIAFHNNLKIGSISIEFMYNPYEYEFEDVFDEETFNEIFPKDEIIKISHLVVNDKFKNQGIATTLMNKALSNMKKKGYTQFYLNASPMGYTGLNLSNLVGFYSKFGFKELLHQGNNSLMALTI